LPYFYVFGHDLQGFAVERFKIVQGKSLSEATRTAPRTARGSRAIILGVKAAEALKLNVGDSLPLPGGTFRVVGIYETGSGFEDAGSVLSLPDAQQLAQKARQVGAVQVKLRDVRQTEQVRARLQRLYPRLTVSQSGDIANQQQMVGMIQGFALGIALLAVVIGGVGMTNTVMMSTFERTHEIGTLRALGWSRQRVVWMVLAESVLLGAAGGLVGCLVGAALIQPMSRSPALSFLQGKLTPALLLQGMLTAVVLGSVGGIYPAWWASRLLPVEAMRYEGGTGDSKLRLPPVKSEILRSLWRRRGRTFLTVLGIGIGLSAVMALGGLADGLAGEFSSALLAGDMDLVARQAGISDIGFSTLSERVGREIAAIPGVEGVTGLIISAVAMEKEGIPFLMIMGYPAEHPYMKSHFQIVEGRGLVGNREVILGRATADALNTAVGRILKLADGNFRVVGLFETGVSWEEGGAAVVSLRDAQAILGKPRQVSLYAIKVKDLQQADATRKRIEAQVAEVAVARSSEFTENLPEMQNMAVITWAISALAVLVGGIGMMNTVSMSVFERTREIGTLRALGWRRRRVLAMVLRESVVVSLIGALVGGALSLLLASLVRRIPMWGGWLVLALSPGLLARVFAVALVLGIIGGAYPAWRASRLSPVEALRYE